VTARFPFEPAAQFFEPEVRSLLRYADVYVVPTRPRGNILHYDLGAAKVLRLALSERSVLHSAWREFARHPVAVARLLAHVTLARSAPRARIVNFLSFPTGLALADEVRRLGIEHIHAQWLTSPATVGYVASLLTGVPFSASAHQHDIFFDNLVVPKAAHARFVRVISDRNRHHLEKRLPPALRGRSCTVHLGVEVPAAPAHPSHRVPRILCAARLCPWKGHRYLLAALALLRDRGVPFECDLAGDGELRREVAATIARYGLAGRVRMLGNLAHPDLLESIGRGDYDLFALASTERPGEHEGIAVAAMEAMAAGLPVVATRTGSLGELVDADCGILLPQRDPELFAGALGRLLDDPALRKRLGQAGRRRVLAKFSTESTTFALAQLLGAVPATAIGPDYRAPIGLPSHGEGNVGALAAWKDAVS